jgi:hypothetical protein
MEEKLPVKLGAGTAPTLMTRQQAERYGQKMMDPKLRRVGFVCVVTRSDPEMHGGLWFRVSYGYDRRDNRRS